MPPTEGFPLRIIHHKDAKRNYNNQKILDTGIQITREDILEEMRQFDKAKFRKNIPERALVNLIADRLRSRFKNKIAAAIRISPLYSGMEYNEDSWFLADEELGTAIRESIRSEWTT